jgi:hypothetical protein
MCWCADEGAAAVVRDKPRDAVSTAVSKIGETYQIVVLRTSHEGSLCVAA